tara:strand:+ start:1571 stop:1747 length:177 start_codon:yes stop_codon:yes gene_type:complete
MTYTLTSDELRLLKFGIRFTCYGNWALNQDDAIPSLEHLEELGLIERNADGNKWRTAR